MNTRWTCAISALLLVLAAVPARTASIEERALAYYQAVVADRAPGVHELRRALGDSTLVVPIGWTASGKVFADILAGEMTRETRVIAPGRVADVFTITRLSLPEYFSHLGERRCGFSSIESDSIFLDARRDTDPDVLADITEHEIQHLLDRPFHARLTPAGLEIRAALRALSRSRRPDRVLAELQYARREGKDHYRLAAERLLAALAIVCEAPGLDALEPNACRSAALVLATLIGL